jgi:hypothetical protein
MVRSNLLNSLRAVYIVPAVKQVGGCRRGFGGTLNDKTIMGYGISSLRGGGFSNLKARAVDSIWTT